MPAAPLAKLGPYQAAVVPVQAGQSGRHARGTQTSAFRQIILPDLLIVAPQGLTKAQIARLRKIAGVRDMITFDGAEITAGGRSVSAIGVNPSTFRSWVPLATASDQAFWSALSNGDFVAAQPAGPGSACGPARDTSSPAPRRRPSPYGMSAKLGLTGVDLLVNVPTSRKLGLVRQVAGLISAPGAGLTALTKAVGRILGPTGRIEVLRSKQLPLATGRARHPAGQLPAAVQGVGGAVLPGPVLDGAGGHRPDRERGRHQRRAVNRGRHGAHAVPARRRGRSGAPMASATPARRTSSTRTTRCRRRRGMLCADGAAAGGQALSQAIFDYNHANWYVREVLALAAEYAADYR